MLDCDIYCEPVGICAGRVRIRCLGHGRDAHDLAVFAAVIEQAEVANGHGTQIVAGLKIAYSRPCSRMILLQVMPAVGLRLTFEYPILHEKRVSRLARYVP